MDSRSILIFYGLLVLLAVQGVSCARTDEPGQKGLNTVVFKHGKIAGDPERFSGLLRRFEALNPGLSVKEEVLPSTTDEQHQYYVINLEGGSSDFDVLGMDVIWVQEFARAGWLQDISTLLPPVDMDDYFPGPVEAVTFRGKIYAIPWYIDAGVLYYRKDLLDKYGYQPPDTWDGLVRAATDITAKEPGMYGYIWQGKQYEGLVCNALEFIWGNGGEVVIDGRSVIDSKENVEALSFMRDLITRYKVTPALVTTLTEEPSRRIFEQGKAVFMRNWPYAWNIFQREGSPVRGKVGVTMLPSFAGHGPASALGGWQLGVNRNSKNPLAAEKLVAFLTSPDAQKEMALAVGYKPTRVSLYRDRGLLEAQPYLEMLYGVFMHARPRPLTPFYMQLTQVLQPGFSSVLAGYESPEDTLGRAQREIDYILGQEKPG